MLGLADIEVLLEVDTDELIEVEGLAETDVLTDGLELTEVETDVLTEGDVLGELETEVLGELERLGLADTEVLGEELTELETEGLVLTECEREALTLVDGAIGPIHFPAELITCLSFPFGSLTQNPPPVVTHSFCFAIRLLFY